MTLRRPGQARPGAVHDRDLVQPDGRWRRQHDGHRRHPPVHPPRHPWRPARRGIGHRRQLASRHRRRHGRPGRGLRGRPGRPGRWQNHPVRGTTPITIDAWHHAAATYDGTTWRIYLDGQLEATQAEPRRRAPTRPSMPASGAMLNSSGTPGNTARFHGILDETRVWNSARSLAQIQATINSQPIAGPGRPRRSLADERVGQRRRRRFGDVACRPPTARSSAPERAAFSGAPFDIVFDTTPPAPPPAWSRRPATPPSTWPGRPTASPISRATASTGRPRPAFRRRAPRSTGQPSGRRPAFADDTAVNGTPYYYVGRCRGRRRQPVHAVERGHRDAAAAPPGANGLDLGSSGAYVTFGNPPKLDLGQFTIETWFKRTGTDVASTSGTGGIASFVPLVTNGGPEDDWTRTSTPTGCSGSTTRPTSSPPTSRRATGRPASTTRSAASPRSPSTSGTTPPRPMTARPGGCISTAGSRRPCSSNAAPLRHDPACGLGAMLNSDWRTRQHCALPGCARRGRVWNAARSQAQIRATINAELTRRQRPGRPLAA